jgi:hypothetical protein
MKFVVFQVRYSQLLILPKLTSTGARIIKLLAPPCKDNCPYKDEIVCAEKQRAGLRPALKVSYPKKLRRNYELRITCIRNKSGRR